MFSIPNELKLQHDHNPHKYLGRTIVVVPPSKQKRWVKRSIWARLFSRPWEPLRVKKLQTVFTETLADGEAMLHDNVIYVNQKTFDLLKKGLDDAEQ